MGFRLTASTLAAPVHDFVAGFVAADPAPLAARRAVLLAYFEGLGSRSVARETGLSEPKVRRLRDAFDAAFTAWAKAQVEAGRTLTRTV